MGEMLTAYAAQSRMQQIYVHNQTDCVSAVGAVWLHFHSPQRFFPGLMEVHSFFRRAYAFRTFRNAAIWDEQSLFFALAI